MIQLSLLRDSGKNAPTCHSRIMGPDDGENSDSLGGVRHFFVGLCAFFYFTLFINIIIILYTCRVLFFVVIIFICYALRVFGEWWVYGDWGFWDGTDLFHLSKFILWSDHCMTSGICCFFLSDLKYTVIYVSYF